MEIYGRNSRCFEQRKPFEMRFNGTVTSQSKYGAGCYEVRRHTAWYNMCAGHNTHTYTPSHTPHVHTYSSAAVLEDCSSTLLANSSGVQRKVKRSVS